jgi:cell division protein FtsN
MRRVRSDGSRRIRRPPSIFSARWFRICLGAGVAVVVVLLMGPWVAGWFGSDLPRSLFLLAPWSTAVGTNETPKPGDSSPVASSPGPPAAPGTLTGKTSGATAEGKSGSSVPVATAGSATTPSSGTAGLAPAATAPGDARAGAVSTGVPPALSTPSTEPPAVYWVQVGAFLEHKNADRLAERLRSEGLSAATTAFEQSRVRYRVLLVGAEGGSVSDDVIERARGLGHPVETTVDGPAVTGLVPLRRAVETSHTLRQQGVRVRLKQEVSSSTYRVVRVGSFTTVTDAEAALATLAAKGVEGIVVRER